ncbi:DMT family transporter [Streptacidiphilus sp. EB129]|uniref:DMT family transporter n=1 Tax=Streptacidiphilus sp. EB129 TaxID=3156262 RepID=UPI003511B3E6
MKNPAARASIRPRRTPAAPGRTTPGRAGARRTGPAPTAVGRGGGGAAHAVLATSLIGTSFVAMSLLGHYPVLGGQAARYAAAAVVLFLLAVRRGVDIAAVRTLPPRQWLRLALLAAGGMVGFNLAVIAAERTAEPAVPGVVVGCAPLAMAVLAPLLERRRPSPRIAAAALLVVAGAAVVQGLGRTDAAGFGYSLLALAGEVAFGLLAVPLVRALGPLLLAGCACAMGAAQALAAGLLLEGPAMLRMPTAEEAAALVWMALPVTVVAFWAWYSAVQGLGAERAGLFSGVIPVAAAATAPLVGTGTLGAAQIAGSLLVAAGVGAGLRAARGRPGPVTAVRTAPPGPLPDAAAPTPDAGSAAAPAVPRPRPAPRR